MKKLIIKPVGGLCTRLLAVDSAIKIQELVKPKETIIIWERNRNINCSFKDLFYYPDQIHFIETQGFNKFSLNSYFEVYNSFHPSNFRWPLFNRLLGRERRYESVFYADELDQKSQNDLNYFPDTNVESLYISFYQRFGTKSNEIYNFQPIDVIAKQVEQIVCTFNEDIIGVHIRRTDHKSAIRYSPTAGFLKAMEKKMENCDASFFLSTDSDRVKKTILKRFGKRVLTCKRELDRNSPAGIKDAVIDLFCLSKTNEIIGSYESTFSQVAAELGGIDNQEIYVNNKETSA